jgi:hypothetical protein
VLLQPAGTALLMAAQLLLAPGGTVGLPGGDGLGASR